MDPTSETDRYLRILTLYGETVTLRIFSGQGAARTSIDAACLARVRFYKPEELIGTINQGDQEIILLAADAPNPPKSQDMVVFRGHRVTILGVDDNTRVINGSVIAYTLHCRG